MTCSRFLEAPTAVLVLKIDINNVGNDLGLDFDATKPTGVPYRVGDIERIRALGFHPQIDLDAGLESTISDFRFRYGPVK